jgi:hypothetical protein
VIQALISRGDRRLAPVIAAVRGSQESLGGWKRAYRAVREGTAGDLIAGAPTDLPPPPPWETVIHHTWNPDTPLPWTHLRGPLEPAVLQRHWQEALIAGAI